MEQTFNTVESLQEFESRITSDNRLRSRYLAPGERPDMRPWGGHFDHDGIWSPRGKKVVALGVKEGWLKPVG